MWISLCFVLGIRSPDLAPGISMSRESWGTVKCEQAQYKPEAARKEILGVPTFLDQGSLLARLLSALQ
jgi:hypothetical protein